jgi:ATP-dependent Lhr-like helicase
MTGRDLLAEAAADLPFDPDTVDVADEGAFDRLDPAVQSWWVDRFGEHVADNGGFFTPPQREAVPLIDAGENALLSAPTGSGKTLAAFTAIVDDLVRRERAAGLENSVYCLYVSPLKSLANDVHRNLERPLDGVAARVDGDVEVRHAIRHGDTDDAERRRMLERTPHILNTTPETLAILLNAPSFREKLRTVEYVVVDEIHSLADGKRGTHLSVSLERLEELTASSPTRVGCSATVEPLSTVAEFLVGRETPGGDARDCEVVDCRFARDYDLRLECPTDDLVETPRDTVRERFYDRLDELVAAHETTLVFTNTRSGAERTLQALRERHGHAEERSACHHGSLSTETRQAVEASLKAGDLDVVTTSTSLELGIDMPDVDLVVQVGSPKSVAALLQRVGRAGHSLGRTVEGRVVALDRDELFECAVLVRRAVEGDVDRVFVPERAADVAAQHVYGMAIAGVRPESEVVGTLRRAYPYRNFDDGDVERLFRYLTADHDGLDGHNVYPKVWRDANDPPDGEHHHPEYGVGERLVGKRGRLARVIYMTNVGTIPDSFTCDVVVRGDDERVGRLDEDYLDTLDPGEVFALGGGRFAFRYRRGSKVYVDRTDERPTVPSWFAERLPLSYDAGRALLGFRRKLLSRFESGGEPAVRDWLRGPLLDENGVRILTRTVAEQVAYAGAEGVSTPDRIAVEEVRDREAYRRRYHVHAAYGRRFNDGLSRLVANRCGSADGDVRVAVADNGFSVTMPLNRRADVAGIVRDLNPEDVDPELREALAGTELLKRYFRIDATRSLAILERYRGRETSAAQRQVASETLLSFAEDLEGFAVLEETYRELLEDRLNAAGLREVLAETGDGIAVVSQTLESPSPLSFGLATLSASDVVLAGDGDDALREFRERVRAAVEGGTGDDEGSAPAGGGDASVD